MVGGLVVVGGHGGGDGAHGVPVVGGGEARGGGCSWRPVSCGGLGGEDLGEIEVGVGMGVDDEEIGGI